MQKRMFATGIAVFLVLAASAQVTQKDGPPQPPPPPKPAVKIVKDVPPPPPPAPSEPAPPDAPAPPPPPVNMKAQVSGDFDAFLKKNPSVKGVAWRNDELIIKLKSGKEERYNLANAADRKAVEATYGELPPAPPPPPPPPAPKPPKMKRTLS